MEKTATVKEVSSKKCISLQNKYLVVVKNIYKFNLNLKHSIRH